MDVRVTVPDDLVVKASELRTPGAPVSLGALNLTLGGDLRATKAPGQQIALVGTVNTVRGTYDFQGRRFDILRDGTVRFDGEPLNELNPILDLRTQPGDSGRRGARQRPRHAEAAGDRAEQHAAARAGRHPVAHRLQPADQLSSAKGSRCRWRSARSRWRPAQLAGAAVAVDRQRARPRHVRDQHGAGQRRRRVADRRPAARPEPLRQSGAGHRRSERRPTSSSSTSSRSGCGCGPTCCRAPATQQQLFQRAQGSGADLLFFFSY